MNRLEDRARAWGVVVERVTETENAVLAFGSRKGHPVVLKIIKQHGDERHAGAVLSAFEGRGVVRVYEYSDGALLLERLSPGDSLGTRISDDDRATAVLAETIATMSRGSEVFSTRAGNPSMPTALWKTPPTPTVATAHDWGQAFDRYATTADAQIPRDLLSAAHRTYFDLCGSQTSPRLLHGDLHHHNVLFDDQRGWLAIDPKGVVAELDYELGAALRNPYERPELFADPAVVQRRAGQFARGLRVDESRVLAWAFAQAVLAAVWLIEDGHRVEPHHGFLTLARTLQSMLDTNVEP
jgi:streptomycin 6-kinase